jgi:hypothetical protein
MANDAKLGLLAGVAVVLMVAVFFYPKSGQGLAAIPGAPAASNGNSPPGQPPAQMAAPAGTGPQANGIWKFSEPRTQKPVSKDPLTWPQN